MRSSMLSAGLALLLAVPAIGQEPAAPLTMSQAIDEALSRNPDLVALRREYDVARAMPARERFLDAPSFEAQIWAWPVTTLNPIRTDMYMVTVEQELPGRGKRAARVLVGERDALVTRRQVSVRANDILEEVRQAYAGLALARQTVILYERQVPVLRDFAEAATVRYASGHAEQHDAVSPLVELVRLESDAITWRARVRSEEARLNTLLGRPVDRPVGAVAPMTSAAVSSHPEAVALERHPALALAAAEIAREEAELARLRGERRPNFVVGGGYMLTPGEAGAWTARGGITWPNAPWSRGGLNAAIDVQSRRIEAVASKREAMASAIRRGVYDAQVRLEAARQRADLISTTLLPHVHHAFDVFRAAYAAGRAEFGDIIDGQRSVLAVEVESVAAQAEVVLALSGLDWAIGAVREEMPPAQRAGEQP